MADSIGGKSSRLVCLHVPKTADSSLRETIRSVYGAEQMYWFSDDHATQDIQPFPESAVAGKLFIGGHRPLIFYPMDAQHLYIAALRHAVERVRSLFSYFTRPEEGGSEDNVAGRQRVREQRLRQGIVPESLVDSIDNCGPFRESIGNEQCRYLSNGAATFAAAQETLESGNFPIGNSAQLGVLVETLGSLFQWPETREVRTNISVAQGEDDILSEPDVVERILECGAEGLKLYDYLQQQHGGLYYNLPDRESLLASTLRFTDAKCRAFSKLAWNKIELSTVDAQESVRPGITSVKLLLRNCSRECLNPECEEPIAISFILLDQMGDRIERVNPHSPLQVMLGPGEAIEAQVKLVIPEDLPKPAAWVRFSLIVEKRFWLSRSCPDHGLDLPILPT